MSDKYSKRRLKSSSITTVVSIALVLFMLGLLGMLILNAKKLSDYVKENIGFQIYLTEDAKEDQVISLQKMLNESSYVKSTQYITKEQAAKKLQQDLGEDFISFLEYNPLPASINVNFKADYANADSIAQIEKNLKQNKIVEEVSYQKSLITVVNENVKKASLVILVFSAVLMILALALINNTIRLSIYSKRFLIKTMQLVGATQGFIRRPFILTGIKHGVIASFIAMLMLAGLIFLAKKNMPELVELQDLKLLGTLFGIVLLLGILISGISTSLAVRKYLRLKADDLYY